MSFTDDRDNQETLVSAATGEVAAKPNSPATGAPTISGTVQVGQTLTASTSDIADEDGLDDVTYSYQWIANDGSTDADIQDATDATYTLVETDEGKTIKVRVSFIDDRDNQETLTSAPSTEVAAKPNSLATGAPTISGTAQVGQTLTASVSGIADADGLDDATFSYQWVANDGSTDADIQDATDATYTLVETDEGKTIKVKVSFTDDRGNEETLTSAATTIAELPVVSIVAVASPVSEGETAEFTVSRTGPTTEALTVQTNWAYSDGSTIQEISVLFQAGKRDKTSHFKKDDDQVVRDDLTVTVTLVDGEGYKVSEAAASAQVVLEDNDVAEFALSVDPVEVAEGESTTVQVEISNGVTFAADQTIALDFAESTATKGADFTVSPESLTLSAEASSASATVTALVDTDEEGDEMVSIAATHGGETIGTGAVTISDAMPLTASFTNVPASHDGENVFTFNLSFSEPVAVSYKVLRDQALSASNGTVRKCRRVDGRNDLWEVHIEPDSHDDITVTLSSPSSDCDDSDAVCTAADKLLSNAPSATITGPAAKVVAAYESPGLLPNVPNPFNASTLLSYRLATLGAVRLDIYNLLGQPMRTLVNQVQDAGVYHVHWDARDQRGAAVAAGVYLVRLQYPGGVQTRRLLYLK